MHCLTPLYITLAMGGLTPDPVSFADGRPTSVGEVDSTIYPIRCHFEEARYATKCAVVIAAAEAAWALQVDEIGFRAPEPDTDGILDFYLAAEGTEGGAVTIGSYIDPEPLDDYISCPAYVVIHPDISEEELPSFVVHEFQHVTQYATDFMEFSLPIWEAVATETERYNLDGGSVLRYQIAAFQDDPWLGVLGDGYVLDSRGDGYSEYEYGAVLWILDLDDRFGDGAGAAAQALWAAANQPQLVNEPDVVDAWDTVSGDWRQALLDLNLLRARLGTAAAPTWEDYLSSASMRVWFDEEVDAAAFPVELTPDPKPWPTGSVFVHLTGLTPGEPVALTVTPDTDGTFGLAVLDGESGLTAAEPALTFTPTGAEVDVAVVCFGPSDFDADRDTHGYGYTLRVEAAPAPVDTGAPDEDSPPVAAAGGGDEKGGCACASVEPAGLWSLLGLGGLLLRRRRLSR